MRISENQKFWIAFIVGVGILTGLVHFIKHL
jgi:hypothetical protein